MNKCIGIFESIICHGDVMESKHFLRYSALMFLCAPDRAIEHTVELPVI